MLAPCLLFAIILYTSVYVLLFMALLPFERIKRTIVIKKACSPNPMFGLDPQKRPIQKLVEYGVVNINKPDGPTSHVIADYVKQLLHIDKAGHSGTLDPGVTGVLPIALGSATRIVQVLLPAGKEYVALMHIHKPVDEKLLKKTLNEFIGKITQLPPLKSAVKRQFRERSIYYIEIMELEPQDVLFCVGCVLKFSTVWLLSRVIDWSSIFASIQGFIAVFLLIFCGFRVFFIVEVVLEYALV